MALRLNLCVDFCSVFIAQGKLINHLSLKSLSETQEYLSLLINELKVGTSMLELIDVIPAIPFPVIHTRSTL